AGAPLAAADLRGRRGAHAGPGRYRRPHPEPALGDPHRPVHRRGGRTVLPVAAVPPTDGDEGMCTTTDPAAKGAGRAAAAPPSPVLAARGLQVELGSALVLDSLDFAMRSGRSPPSSDPTTPASMRPTP